VDSVGCVGRFDDVGQGFWEVLEIFLIGGYDIRSFMTKSGLLRHSK
jgi:hypothetical protein